MVDATSNPDSSFIKNLAPHPEPLSIPERSKIIRDIRQQMHPVWIEHLLEKLQTGEEPEALVEVGIFQKPAHSFLIDTTQLHGDESEKFHQDFMSYLDQNDRRLFLHTQRSGYLVGMFMTKDEPLEGHLNKVTDLLKKFPKVRALVSESAETQIGFYPFGDSREIDGVQMAAISSLFLARARLNKDPGTFPEGQVFIVSPQYLEKIRDQHGLLYNDLMNKLANQRTINPPSAKEGAKPLIVRSYTKQEINEPKFDFSNPSSTQSLLEKISDDQLRILAKKETSCGIPKNILDKLIKNKILVPTNPDQSQPTEFTVHVPHMLVK